MSLISVDAQGRYSVSSAEDRLCPAKKARERGPRRNVSREAARAVEMLGHAIEYLVDEYVLDCITGAIESGRGMHPRLVAIEVLKTCNREVYLSCPVVPRLGERFLSWLRATRPLHWQRR